jgi:hypothetical protein
MKRLWVPSDLVFPQDHILLKERLTDRFSALDQQSEQYRLEAKFQMAGESLPSNSIVLFNQNWSNRDSLAKVVSKLEQEYDLPVILIGTSGRGITNPSRSFLLKEVSGLLKEYHESGEFIVAEDKIEETIDRLQRLCRSYRSSNLHWEIKTEAKIDYEKIKTTDLYQLYQIVSPFISERPLFILSSFPILSQPYIIRKDIEFKVRGHTFIYPNQSQSIDKIKRWGKVDFLFYVDQPNKSLQFKIQDIQPTFQSAAPRTNQSLFFK